MGLFETMVQNMQRMEFFQYLFPFLLAFALLYGLMQWAFKENLGGRRVHTLIAIILSFFVMLYSSYNTWLFALLTTTSGIWLGLATVALLLVLFAQLLGIDIGSMLSGAGGSKYPWIKWIILLIIVWIVLSAFLGYAGMSAWLPYWLTGSDLWTVLLVVVIIGAVFYFVGEDSGKSSGGSDDKAKPS
ncbi:MAG: hypothetical protein JW789_03785 [Candidatus Aenigmarchaeota archaeon]|nr:hypothetical protein [Candidatus Aenigmarchaeota archaeon]